jgi:hypothetical protein
LFASIYNLQDALRTALGPLTSAEIAAAVMQAKGMPPASRVQGNRREAGARLRKRGTLVEHGTSRDAQWALVHPFADVGAF